MLFYVGRVSGLCEVGLLVFRKSSGFLFNHKGGVFFGVSYLLIETISLLVVLSALKLGYSEADQARWVYLSAFSPVAQLLISGFGSLIVREISGSVALGRSHVVNDVLWQSVGAVRISSVVLFLLTACVGFYLSFSWGIFDLIGFFLFMLTILSRMLLQWVGSLLVGLGVLGLDKLVLLVCSGLSLGFVFCLARSGVDFWILVLGYLVPFAVGAGVLLIVAFRVFFADYRVSPVVSPVSLPIKPNEIVSMYIVNIAGFLTLGSDLFIARVFLRHGLFIDYSLLSKAVVGIIAVMSIYANLKLRLYSELFLRGDRVRFWREVRFISLGFVVLGLGVSVGFLCWFHWFFDFFLGRSLDLGSLQLVLGAIFATAVGLVVNFGNAVIATGRSSLVYVSVPCALFGFGAAVLGGFYFGLNGMLSGMVGGVLISAGSHFLLLYRRFPVVADPV